MNTSLEMLLAKSADAVKRDSKQIEIKRLSNRLGGQFVLTCTSITMEEFKDIQEKSRDGGAKSDFRNVDPFEMQVQTVLKGVDEFGPSHKEDIAELKKAFGVPNIKELVVKLLLPGEIAQLAAVVTDLSGFDGDMITELKNE